MGQRAGECTALHVHSIPLMESAEVPRITDRIARRTIKMLERRALGSQSTPDKADPFGRCCHNHFHGDALLRIIRIADSMS